MTSQRASSRPPAPLAVERFEGPAGVRLVVPIDGGFAIRWESGAAIGDPFVESLAEARDWVSEIVNATGAVLHTAPPAPARPSPNESFDALAKARPRPPLRTTHVAFRRGRA